MDIEEFEPETAEDLPNLRLRAATVFDDDDEVLDEALGDVVGTDAAGASIVAAPGGSPLIAPPLGLAGSVSPQPPLHAEARVHPYSLHGGGGAYSHAQHQQQQQYPHTHSHLQPVQPRVFVPDVIKNFLLYFHRHVKERNVHEIHSIYENSFVRLTEKFYKTSPWPAPELIAPLVEHDRLFGLLYCELYYRHIYSKLKSQLTLQHRIESWQNYSDLFQHVLQQTEHGLELPPQWLWDIVDEYIYQFQSFWLYVPKARAEELQQTIPNKVWNVVTVLSTLHQLADKSGFLQWHERGQEQPTNDQSASTLFRVLGFFALVGQLRVHCLLGDYHTAVRVLDHVELSRKGLFGRVTACQITLYYYLGVAYLMLRRYVDAIKTFVSILLYISRTKQFHTRSYQYEAILKKNDQMYALLAVAVSLCPQRIDENVHSVLKEKHADKMSRMQRGDGLADIAELFNVATPKSIAPVAAPDLESVQLLLSLNGSISPALSSPATVSRTASSTSEVAVSQQSRLFLAEVAQQTVHSPLPTIRSYLKLYTTISTAKLASFVEVSEPVLRQHLMCFKHKMHNLVWQGGAPLSGKYTFTADVDFYLEQDMIHIADSKVVRRYGDFFIRHIQKLAEVPKNLEHGSGGRYHGFHHYHHGPQYHHHHHHQHQQHQQQQQQSRGQAQPMDA